MKKDINNLVVPEETKVAVIVPLYGYWKDANGDQLTADILKFSLHRIITSSLKQYIIFVGEKERLSDDVASILGSKAVGGNVGFVDVPKGTPYALYIKNGIDFVLRNTNAHFIIGYNPWIMVRHGSLELLCDRLNKQDVSIVSSFELKGLIDPKDFDTWSAPMGYREERDMNPNFWGMIRSTAEMIPLDANFKTHYFFGRDLWQQSYSKGFDIITSQYIPSYSFDVDWTLIEDVDQFEEDKKCFVSKWKFDPSIKYKQ